LINLITGLLSGVGLLSSSQIKIRIEGLRNSCNGGSTLQFSGYPAGQTLPEPGRLRHRQGRLPASPGVVKTSEADLGFRSVD
jgi:hypothetical protein